MRGSRVPPATDRRYVSRRKSVEDGVLGTCLGGEARPEQLRWQREERLQARVTPQSYARCIAATQGTALVASRTASSSASHRRRRGTLQRAKVRVSRFGPKYASPAHSGRHVSPSSPVLPWTVNDGRSRSGFPELNQRASSPTQRTRTSLRTDGAPVRPSWRDGSSSAGVASRYCPRMIRCTLAPSMRAIWSITEAPSSATSSSIRDAGAHSSKLRKATRYLRRRATMLQRCDAALLRFDHVTHRRHGDGATRSPPQKRTISRKKAGSLFGRARRPPPSSKLPACSSKERWQK